MWQGQTVKIWKLNQKKLKFKKTAFENGDVEEHDDEDDELLKDSYQLVSKLTLADEDNISTVAISQDGTKLAVGRLTTTKLFDLIEKPDSHKLKVSKIPNLAIAEKGSRFLSFYGNDASVLAPPDNEIYKFKLSDDDSELDSDSNETSAVEYELHDLPRSKSKLPFIENINNFKISHSKLVVSRISGAVDIIDLDDAKKTESVPFLRLSSYIHKLEISPRFTLVLITFENKLYEFDLKNFNSNSTNTHLTQWSKVNSEFLPRTFTASQDLPLGIFFDSSNDHKVWVYGSTWLVFFDLSLNIPLNKFQNDRKRNREGFQIGVTEQNENSDDEMDVDDFSDDDLDNSLIDSTKYEERLNILKRQGLGGKGVPYWITVKYKPILFASSLVDNMNKEEGTSEELVIVERPQFALSQPPAFKLNQFRI
jgi:U3 small nucleolar RNA-associated protein 4